MDKLKDKQMKSVLEFNKSRADHVAVFLAHTFGSMKFLYVRPDPVFGLDHLEPEFAAWSKTI